MWFTRITLGMGIALHTVSICRLRTRVRQQIEQASRGGKVMARIEVIGPDQAAGELKTLYEEAIKRAGRIWNIVSIMSQNPSAMAASMQFYMTMMFGVSPLTRSQREMLATVVSATNDCVY